MIDDSDLEAQIRRLSEARSPIGAEEAKARSALGSQQSAPLVHHSTRRVPLLVAAGFGILVAIGAGALVTTLPSAKKPSLPIRHLSSTTTSAPTVPTTAPLPTSTTIPQIPANTGMSLQFVNPEDGWMAVDGPILRTINGGQTWRQSYSRSAGSVDFVNDVDGWAIANTVIRTEDGGNTWQALTEPRQGRITYLDFTSPSDGWALTEHAVLLSTSDAGFTWRTLDTPSPAVAVCAEPSGELWIAGDNQNIYLNDGGVSGWKMVLSIASVPPLVVGNNYPIDEYNDPSVKCSGSTAWVSFSTFPGMSEEPYIVEQTTDQGAHWSPVLRDGMAVISGKNISASSELAYFGLTGPSDGWVLAFCQNCSSDQVLFAATTDGGITFHTSTLLPEANVYENALGSSVLNAQDGWVLVSRFAADASPGKAILLGTSNGAATWHVVDPSVP
jgi:Photosynthesis system II assembly factor YCF48